MVKKICVYGKGGIGKSTVVSNMAVALSEMGKRVMVIGCDPKADSTRNIVGRRIRTVLNEYKSNKNLSLDNIIFKGYGGVYCVESGGPEPGVGCAGRGVIAAIDILDKLGAFEKINPDVVIYDILGDVVCGGFAMPLQKNLADEVYIVTTSDPMALYAANNICKGIKRYSNRGARLGGIIYNERSVIQNSEIVEKFVKRVSTKIIGKIPMDERIVISESFKKTVIEKYNNSDISNTFRDLSLNIYNNKERTIPQPMDDEEFDKFIEDIY